MEGGQANPAAVLRAAYEAAAPAYQAAVVPTFRAVAAEFARRLAPRPHERGLDLATGTGLLAAALLDRAPGCRITGLDLSRAMLVLAGQTVPLLSRIEGNARDLPFRDGVFDFVGCQFGYHHLPDPGRALREAWRVTQSGGRLAIAGWQDQPERDDPLDAAFRAAFPRAYPETAGPNPARDGERARTVAQAAGWQATVTVESARFRFADAAAYYAWRTAFPGDAAWLAEQPPDRQRAIRQDTIAALRAAGWAGSIEQSEAVFFLVGAAV